jgi:SAM-dependent methyltransferase
LYSTDLAYVHHAGFGELARLAAPELVRILRAHGIPRGHIVELGCGSGITARYLIEHGYDVTGIDASKAMIRLAREIAPKARLRVASLTRARIPRCDAVIAIGEVVTYVPGDIAALERVFASVRKGLAPGGVLIFDFIESGERRTYKSRNGRDWVIASRATLDRSRRILTRQIVVVRHARGRFRRANETHTIRIYNRRVIRDALARAGFSVRMSRSYGRYKLLPGDVAVIARRTQGRAFRPARVSV